MIASDRWVTALEVGCPHSPEVRESAVRSVLDHERDPDSRWAAIRSVSEEIGCTPDTLREWVPGGEGDSDRRDGRQRTSGSR